MHEDTDSLADEVAAAVIVDELDSSKADPRDMKLPRLRSSQVVAALFREVFELELPILKTVIGLTIRPGRTCRDYVDGYRRRYTNPMKYAFLTATLMVVVYTFFEIDPSSMFGVASPTVRDTSLTGPDGEDVLADPDEPDRDESEVSVDDEENVAASKGDDDAAAPGQPELSEEESERRRILRERLDPAVMQQELTGVVNANLHLVSFFTLPFVAGVLRLLVFRRSGLNFAEHYAFALFIWGHTYLFDAVCGAFLHSAGAWGFLIMGIVAFAYEIWAAVQFYQQPLWLVGPKMIIILIATWLFSTCLGACGAMLWFVWLVWDSGAFG